MSWFWLSLLALAGGALWIWHRRRLQADAMLQESLDRPSPESEPKRPPAKQPWQRPGFGPAPRMDALEFGSGPVPPPAGGGEDPTVAGPMPDDEDVPALIPIEVPEEEESTTTAKLPPPPPPGATESDDAPSPDPDPTAPAAPAAPAAPTAPTAPAAPAASAAEPGPTPAVSPELLAGLQDEDFAIRDPQVLDLPPDLAAEARDLMERKQEVAAVRLVCDSMGVGILDAQRTVRALVNR
jgi:hypothetical protein